MLIQNRVMTDYKKVIISSFSIIHSRSPHLYSSTGSIIMPEIYSTHENFQIPGKHFLVRKELKMQASPVACYYYSVYTAVLTSKF